MGNNFALQKDTAMVLANASELVAGIVTEMAGNDISNSLNGSKVTTDVIAQLACQRIISRAKQVKTQ